MVHKLKNLKALTELLNILKALARTCRSGEKFRIPIMIYEQHFKTDKREPDYAYAKNMMEAQKRQLTMRITLL
jgi:hypothetical protein